MDLGIKGKRAVVTGASRGIGEAIAVSLAKEGCKVAIIARTEADLKLALEQMPGDGHYMIVADLMEEGAPARAIDEINKNFGAPDILVNNLGSTLDITDPFCSLEDWRKVYRINIEVAIEINNLIVPAMKAKKWGRIVNISSISGSENQGPVTYCTAKAALNAYTRSFGRVVSPDGIAVSAVLPGAFYTEGGYWDQASKERPEHVEKYLNERMASHRFGKLEEVSNLVAFLCSDYAGFCVGSIIPIDGGQGRTFSF